MFGPLRIYVLALVLAAIASTGCDTSENTGQSPATDDAPAAQETNDDDRLESQAEEQPDDQADAAPTEIGDEDRRHLETGAFSFIPPEGWSMQDTPGMRFDMAVGPMASGIAANINVIHDQHPGQLQGYIDASITDLERLMSEFELLAEGTTTGITGQAYPWVEFTQVQAGQAYRQRMYFIDAPGADIYIVTCTTHREFHEGDEILPRCDAAVASFRLDTSNAPEDESLMGTLDDDGRFLIPDKLSYRPPQNWEPKQRPGTKYKALMGPMQDGFAPNFIVVDEDRQDLSLAEYVTRNRQSLAQQLGDDTGINDEAFTTADGLRGHRLSMSHDTYGTRLLQIFYLFEGPSQFLGLVCTIRDDQAESMRATCDDTARTVRLAP